MDYCELIHSQGAEVLATYGTDFYKGMAALTVNRYGKGRAYYLPCRTGKDFLDALTERLLKECNITSDFDGELPYGVTAHSRTDGETLYVFLQNFATEERVTSTNHTWVTVDSRCTVAGKITLAPYETLILSRKI